LVASLIVELREFENGESVIAPLEGIEGKKYPRGVNVALAKTSSS